LGTGETRCGTESDANLLDEDRVGPDVICRDCRRSVEQIVEIRAKSHPQDLEKRLRNIAKWR
jgi:hypothetical protein